MQLTSKIVTKTLPKLWLQTPCVDLDHAPVMRKMLNGMFPPAKVTKAESPPNLPPNESKDLKEQEKDALELLRKGIERMSADVSDWEDLLDDVDDQEQNAPNCCLTLWTAEQREKAIEVKLKIERVAMTFVAHCVHVWLASSSIKKCPLCQAHIQMKLCSMLL